MAHLHKLQREHAARGHAARQLAAAPDYSCENHVASNDDIGNDWKVSGTSLGGWLVLEPWITPSLFYQFLGTDQVYGPSIEAIKLKTGMDQKSFCTALGPYEANQQLRRHWAAWLTEDHIAQLKATGSTHVRIPIGDWMFTPYGIYDKVEHGVRCNDGALQELDRVLELCRKYGLQALLDMHAWVGSQNGLDNSGETKYVKWASQEEMDNPAGAFAPIGTFDHWKNKGWDWIINSGADWDHAMELINQDHWDHSMQVVDKVVKRYGTHPAVWGFSPVNEVGAWTPLDVLRKFYWDVYGLVRSGAPHWMVVLDSSFRGGEVGKDNFMRGCPNKAIDKHPYHAWAPWGSIETHYGRSCGWGAEHREIEKEIDFPVIAGEWSLAVDTCAMWLLGFNDMQPGEPRAICDMVPCPCAGGEQGDNTMADCYLANASGGSNQPGLPLDVSEGLRGPFGSGVSGPQFGHCPRDMAMQSNEDEYMTTLAHKQIAAFNEGHGWFFWNFRTEHEPHWDFLEAWKRGWFPRNVSDVALHDALGVCQEGAAPVKPTISPKPQPPKASWLAKNWLSLLMAALGGALLATVIGATLLFGAKKVALSGPNANDRPYTAMMPDA